jgi:hypothetical protein
MSMLIVDMCMGMSGTRKGVRDSRSDGGHEKTLYELLINPFESLIIKNFEQSSYSASDSGSLLNTPTTVDPAFTLQPEKRTLVAHHIK